MKDHLFMLTILFLFSAYNCEDGGCGENPVRADDSFITLIITDQWNNPIIDVKQKDSTFVYDSRGNILTDIQVFTSKVLFVPVEFKAPLDTLLKSRFYLSLPHPREKYKDYDIDTIDFTYSLTKYKCSPSWYDYLSLSYNDSIYVVEVRPYSADEIIVVKK